MKSTGRGKRTSAVEVTAIRECSITLHFDGRDIELTFDRFPWFQGATERQIRNVTRPHPGHLQWPDLDVDLAVDSLGAPERYPLVSRKSGSKAKH
jgi:hypothetical protein